MALKVYKNENIYVLGGNTDDPRTHFKVGLIQWHLRFWGGEGGQIGRR